MEILGKDILGALTSISISDTETFRELDERMIKEHGMRMNFSNLEFGEGLDPDQNVLAYFSRWHTQNENNQQSNPFGKLTEIQAIPQQNGFVEEQQEEEDEFEVEDVFHAVMDGIKYEETIDVKPFTLPGVYQVPIPEHSPKQLSTETSEPNDDTAPARLCRLCAIPGNNMVDMFGPNEPFDNIVEKIEDCLPIVVTRTDALPKQVCRSCLYKLELCHQFHKTVAEAEKQLTMFDGKMPGEFGTPEDDYQASRLSAYDGESSTSSDDDWDDNDSTPLAERLRRLDSMPKKPDASSLANLINYTREFFATTFNAANDTNEDNATRSASNEDENYVTNPVTASVLLSKQESFFSIHMPYVEKEFKEQISDSEPCSPRIVTRSKSLKNSGRQATKRKKKDDYILFGDKSLLRESFASETFQCWICGYGFPTVTECHKHSVIHHSDRYYPCSLCDETYFRTKIEWDEHSLDQHVPNHESDDQTIAVRKKRRPRYGCSKCRKKFVNRDRLQFHKIYHDPTAKPCYCIKCDRTFTSESSLYRHVLIVHTVYKEYFCHLCGQEFRSKMQLNGHQSKHANIAIKAPSQKVVSCSDCGKSYKHKSNLIIHIRTHTGERPFSCDICSKTYMSRAVRNTHRKIHFPQKEARLHECPHCEKTFTTSFSRNAHILLHSRVRCDSDDSSCDICSRKFKWKTSLMKHVKSHKADPPIEITPDPGEIITS